MGKPKKRPPADAADAHKSGGDNAASRAEAAAIASDTDNGYAEASLNERAAAILEADNAEFQENYPGAADSSNLQTCCSNCRTVFEVSVELLTAADTRVRCGECMSIFDALANLRDDTEEDEDLLFDAVGNVIERDSGDVESSTIETASADRSKSVSESARGASRDSIRDSTTHNSTKVSPSLPDAGAASLAGLANDTGSDTGSLDVTYSDFDLFSADAGLPEVAYFDQTRESAEFDFDAVEENDETFSEALFTEDATADAERLDDTNKDQSDRSALDLGSDIDFISDDAQVEPLVFRYQDREEPQTILQKGHAATAELVVHDNQKPTIDKQTVAIDVPRESGSPWLFRIMLLVCLVTIAGGLYAYRERDVLVRHPMVQQLCAFIGCTLPDIENLAALRVINRSVFSHPSIVNALIINISFVNDATFAQRYPVLDIRLTDRNGRLVVSNSIEPALYQESWQPGDKLDSGKRLDISLTVEDPGQRATSFELDFR